MTERWTGELDERAIDRLLQVAEEQDLALLHVRVGRSELRIARVPPSELATVDLPIPVSTRLQEREEAADPHVLPEPIPPRHRAGLVPGVMAAVGDTGDTIDAPMVGAFYRAAAPDQAPCVEIGSTIGVGDTVGLIEAMKVFTAVAATSAGVVTEILVENGAFVEFGQPLVRVEAAQDGAGTGSAPHG